MFVHLPTYSNEEKRAREHRYISEKGEMEQDIYTSNFHESIYSLKFHTEFSYLVLEIFTFIRLQFSFVTQWSLSTARHNEFWSLTKSFIGRSSTMTLVKCWKLFNCPCSQPSFTSRAESCCRVVLVTMSDFLLCTQKISIIIISNAAAPPLLRLSSTANYSFYTSWAYDKIRRQRNEREWWSSVEITLNCWWRVARMSTTAFRNGQRWQLQTFWYIVQNLTVFSRSLLVPFFYYFHRH